MSVFGYSCKILGHLLVVSLCIRTRFSRTGGGLSVVLRMEITNPSRGRLMAIIFISLDSALRIRFRLYHPLVLCFRLPLLGSGFGSAKELGAPPAVGDRLQRRAEQLQCRYSGPAPTKDSEREEESGPIWYSRESKLRPPPRIQGMTPRHPSGGRHTRAY